MNMPIVQKAILYVVSLFITLYGIVYLYLGYKFGEFYFYLLGGVFFLSSAMLFLRHRFSGYLVLICFLIILGKIIISNTEMLLGSITNMEFGAVLVELGGDLFIALLFLVFAFVGFKFQKTV